MIRTLRSGDLRAVARVIGEARRRFEVPDAARIVSCYEAGRDGFWIHRALATLGVHNRVVDSASIEVNRRARRTQTGRIYARKLWMVFGPACAEGAAGAAQRRRRGQHEGPARGRARLARVSQSGADWRAARVCADALSEWGGGAGSGH